VELGRRCLAIALLAVACAGCPQTQVTTERRPGPARKVDHTAAHQVLGYLNDERVAAGLSPLTWHEVSAALAHAYLGEVLENRIAERILGIEKITDAVLVARPEDAAVLQHIALAGSLLEVQQALMKSAEDRAILLAPGATHAGLGIVSSGHEDSSGRREVFLAILVRMRPEGAPDAAAEVPAPAPRPPPPSPPPGMAPRLEEGSRIFGSPAIVPDDRTRTHILRARKSKVIGSFKLCLGLNGTVAEVTRLKSTGFPAYDAKILREMRTWLYRPYKVNGKAVPVCTAVTISYTQR
jgi:hypothetical protein